jgi:AcrR family transcriptional regulator
MEKSEKRQEIIKAAIEVFARNGFRGTTTRDLATRADVNEAIIFRHFNTKQELYRAILEEKVSQGRGARCEENRQLIEAGDDRKFFEAVGHQFLERHETDSTFMRLLMFSALEGHELSQMFLTSMAGPRPTGVVYRKTHGRRAYSGGWIPTLPPALFSGCSLLIFKCRKSLD